MNSNSQFPTPCSQCGSMAATLKDIQPPDSYLHSNLPLSMDDYIKRKQLALSYEETIHSLKKELSSLQTSLSTIRSVQSEVSQLSPIRLAPNEILQHIFSFACEDNDIVEQDGPLWVVRRVCSRWRALTDDYAALWNSFRVSNNVKNRKHAELCLYRVRMCIEKSVALKLSVTIVPYDYDERNGLVPLGIVHLVIKHIARCHSIRISSKLLVQGTKSYGSQIVSQDLPNLRRLGLYSGVFWNAPQLFLEAHALTDVVIYNSRLTELHKFPLANIRRLKLMHCSIAPSDGDSLIPILTYTPLLEELQWVCTKASLLEVPITLPELHTLEFYECDSLLSSIRAPSLTKIRMQWVNRGSDHILGALQTLVSNPGCTVKCLEINLRSIPDDNDIQTLFSIFNQVNELSILSSGIAEHMYSIMSLRADDKIQSLPFLRKLEVGFRRTSSSGTVLSDIIRSRRKVEFLRYVIDTSDIRQIADMESAKLYAVKLQRNLAREHNIKAEVDLKHLYFATERFFT